MKQKADGTFSDVGDVILMNLTQACPIRELPDVVELLVVVQRYYCFLNVLQQRLKMLRDSEDEGENEDERADASGVEGIRDLQQLHNGERLGRKLTLRSLSSLCLHFVASEDVILKLVNKEPLCKALETSGDFSAPKPVHY